MRREEGGREGRKCQEIKQLKNSFLINSGDKKSIKANSKMDDNCFFL